MAHLLHDAGSLESWALRLKLEDLIHPGDAGEVHSLEPFSVTVRETYIFGEICA
jgi:hypothetical protein